MDINELDNEKEEFADFVRFMRKSIKMNQQQFAEKLGFKWERISKYERGATCPRLKKRELIERKIRILVKNELARMRQEDAVLYKDDNLA